MRIDLSSIEGYVAGHLRMFIISVACLVIFLGIIALSVFFIAVRGAEQTMVPDVRNKELTDALLELQVKELYPRLNLRYSQTSSDKGMVLEQDPRPGTIVKAGRRIRLVVSQGVIINKVENFIGRNIDEVKIEIQSAYASSGGQPLLHIKEPIMYEFSSERAGIILAQKPVAGHEITGQLPIEFVVSKGRESSQVMIPELTGLDYDKALDLIGTKGLNFKFETREKRAGENGGIVVYQTPSPNTTANENTIIQLTMISPDILSEKEVFGIFRYTIPLNPYPLAVRLEAILPTDEKIRLLTINYMGGELTVPYKLPAESVLCLYMLNREIHRELVGVN